MKRSQRLRRLAPGAYQTQPPRGHPAPHYLETIENTLGGLDKIIIDQGAESGNGQSVVPYLPLNELRPQRTPTEGGN